MSNTPIWNADKSRLTMETGKYYNVPLAPTEADCRADPQWREGLTLHGVRTAVRIDWTTVAGHPALAHFTEYGPYYGLVLETHYVDGRVQQYLVGRPLHPHSGLTAQGDRACVYRDATDAEITIRLPTVLTLVITGASAGRLDDRHLHHDHADYNTRLAAMEAAMSGIALHLAPDAEDAPPALKALTSFRKG